MDVTATTTQFYKKVAKLLKSKGYKYRRSLASAEEELVWSKDGAEQIVTSGWHGTKGWGPERVAMVLYSGHKPVMDMFDVDDVHGSSMKMTPEVYEQYQANLAKAYKKIDQLSQVANEAHRSIQKEETESTIQIGDKIRYKSYRNNRKRVGVVVDIEKKNGELRYETHSGAFVYHSDLEPLEESDNENADPAVLEWINRLNSLDS